MCVCVCVLSVFEDVSRKHEYAGARPRHVSLFILEYLQKSINHILKDVAAAAAAAAAAVVFDGTGLERLPLLRELSLLQKPPCSPG